MHIQDSDSISIASDSLRKSLPCYPASVIHGHAASRGLDINRFSFGLDTGCVRSLFFIVTCLYLLSCAGLRSKVDRYDPRPQPIAS